VPARPARRGLGRPARAGRPGSDLRLYAPWSTWPARSIRLRPASACQVAPRCPTVFHSTSKWFTH